MSETEPLKIPIKIIETQGEASLVEWIQGGLPHRGYVQNDSLDDGTALADVLAYALPHGPDPMAIDLHKLTRQLRLRNVWTQADFRHQWRAVIRSLLEAMEVR